MLLASIRSATVVRKNAVNGVLDLAGGSLGSDIIELSGEWRFWENEFLKLVEMHKARSRIVIVPKSWKLDGNAKETGGNRMLGYGTYGLWINVKPNYKTETFALFMNRVGSAYKVYVNGELKASVGEVGSSINTSKPERRVQFIPFEVELNGVPIEVSIQVSNYHHPKGGLKDRILFGHADELLMKVFVTSSLDLFSAALIFTAFIYHLTIYVHRGDEPENLKIALYSLMGGGFILGTGQNIITFILPMNYGLFLKLVHLTVVLPVAIYTDMVCKLFPAKGSWLAHKFIVTVCGCYGLMIVLTPPIVFLPFLSYFHLFMCLAAFFWYYILLTAASRNIDGSKILLVGLTGYSLFSIIELLYLHEIVVFPRLLPFGMLLLVLSNVFFVSERYKKSFFLIEDLKFKNKEHSRQVRHVNLEKHKLEKTVHQTNSKLNRMFETIRDPEFTESIDKIRQHLSLIEYIQAGGQVCTVYDFKGNAICSVNVTLKAIEQVFEGELVRCQKSYLVNPNRVIRTHKSGRKIEAELLSGRMIPVGSKYLVNIA